MTREMNKPDWHEKWVNKDKPKERILNPDIAEFFWNCCKMERLK